MVNIEISIGNSIAVWFESLKVVSYYCGASQGVKVVQGDREVLCSDVYS